MDNIYAICVLTNTINNISGYILFDYNKITKITNIKIKVKNLNPGNHGFHIHKYGDLRESCESLCDHFNPYNKSHGNINSRNSHNGDLGNIYANKKGLCNDNLKTNKLRLSGKNSIIGRSIVIHEDEDDLGLTNHKLSLKTGNSGKRIACGVIGYANNTIKN